MYIFDCVCLLPTPTPSTDITSRSYQNHAQFFFQFKKKILHLCICECVYVCVCFTYIRVWFCHSTDVEVRNQFPRVSFLFPPCRSGTRSQVRLGGECFCFLSVLPVLRLILLMSLYILSLEHVYEFNSTLHLSL